MHQRMSKWMQMAVEMPMKWRERIHAHPNEAMKQWIGESMSHKTDDLVKRWRSTANNQWIKRWINQSVNKGTSESVKQRSNDPMNQQMSEAVSQWINDKWSSEAMNQWLHGLMKQWTSESTNQLFSDKTNEQMIELKDEWADGEMRELLFLAELLLHWASLLSYTSLSYFSSEQTPFWATSALSLAFF